MLRDELAIAERVGARSLVADAHHSIGAIPHEQEDYDRAIESLDEAQRLFQEIGMTDRAVDTLSTMGESSVAGRSLPSGSRLLIRPLPRTISGGGRIDPRSRPIDLERSTRKVGLECS